MQFSGAKDPSGAMFDGLEVRWPQEPFVWREAKLRDLRGPGVVCCIEGQEAIFPQKAGGLRGC